MSLLVHPACNVVGDLPVAGDRALAQRAMIVAAMADGTSTLQNLPFSTEVSALANTLQDLGADMERPSPRTLKIRGTGGRFHPPPGSIRSASAEQTFLLVGLLAGLPFTTCLEQKSPGSEDSLASCLTALRTMGAQIQASGDTLQITGASLQGICHDLKEATDHAKSGILLAGLRAEGSTRIGEHHMMRNHMETLLQLAGAQIHLREGSLILTGPHAPAPLDMTLPGDLSQAAFWMALTASRPGSRTILRDIGLNRHRVGFVDILLRMGVGIREEVEFCGDGEWHGHLDIRARALRPTHIDRGQLLSVLNELPALLILLTHTRGTSVVRGIDQLPHENLQRLQHVSEALGGMGAHIDLHMDCLVIHGRGSLDGGEVSAKADQELTKILTLAGLTASSPLQIHDTVSLGQTDADFLISLGLLLRELPEPV